MQARANCPICHRPPNKRRVIAAEAVRCPSCGSADGPAAEGPWWVDAGLAPVPATRPETLPPRAARGRAVRLACLAGGAAVLVGAAVALLLNLFSGENPTLAPPAATQTAAAGPAAPNQPAAKALPNDGALPTQPVEPVPPVRRQRAPDAADAAPPEVTPSKPGTAPTKAPAAGKGQPLPNIVIGSTPTTMDFSDSLAPEDQKRVNEAIKRGVAYLGLAQTDTGSFGNDVIAKKYWPVGLTALPALALLECGIPPAHAAIQKAAAFVRQEAQTVARTYEISLAILFLDRLGDPADRPLLRSLALRLAAGQKAAGGWDYGCPILQPGQEEKWLHHLRQQNPVLVAKEVANEVAVALPSPKQGLEGVMKGMDTWLKTGDNSNTQFALLALWAARRYDLPLDSTVARVVQRFHSSQLPGGWSYQLRHGQRLSGAMTCVGLLGLAVGRGWGPEPPALPGRPLPVDPGIVRGLQALRAYLDDPDDSQGLIVWKGPMNLYFLWSVERVGVLYGLKTIGGKDWYRWGVQLLLPAQRIDGSWDGWVCNERSRSPVYTTSLALLFLRRVDLMPSLGERLRQRMALPERDREKGDPKERPAPKETLKPLSVDLGELLAGTRTERQFVVRGPTPFRITQVEGADRAVAVEPDGQPRAAHTLTVTLWPEAAGPLTRTLRLRTDLPGHPEISVTVTARVLPPE